MNKIITTGCVALAAAASVAMPSKQELAKAKPVVEEITSADLAAFKAGEKTAKNVAVAHIAAAQRTENQAEKYLLCQGAFKLYARCGEYDLAADAIQIMKRDVKDIPQEVIAEIISGELRYVSDGKAPRLVALLKEAKMNAAKGKAAATSASVAKPMPKRSLLSRRVNVKDAEKLQATIDGYTWSYSIKNGEAVIGSGVQDRCAISPKPTGSITIPETIDGVRVTGIGPWAFFQCKELSGVTIHDGISNIDHHAFYECFELKSVVIPQAVKELAGGAFIGCHNLKSVTLPTEMTSIGGYAFWDCFALTTVTIPAKQVGDHAFGNCRELTSVTLTADVESIGSDAFCWCIALKGYVVNSGNKKFASVNGMLYSKDLKELVVCPAGIEEATVLDSVNKVMDSAFIGCSKLKRIIVDDGNRNYASVDGVLYTKDMTTLVACPGGITTLAIPSGVTTIGTTAFSRNTELTTLTMPSSLTNGIGYHAFCATEKIKELTIPASIAWGAFDIARIESVNILSTAKRIEDCAFLRCRKLKNVTLEEGVESIGSSTFAECSSLKAIVIPSSVEKIGDNAFGGCTSMTMVTMSGERPAAGKDVFNNCPNVAVIHVPANAKSWSGMTEWQGKKLVFDAEENAAK